MSELETFLPLVNTTLIVISGVFLLLGYYFIHVRRQVLYHKRAMITATVFAGLFLVVYVLRVWLMGSTPFEGAGWLRAVYLGILVSHMILATLVAPLALVTLYLGLKGKFGRHRRIARITLPTWLYVVVTGWIIYWMLYHMV